MLICRVGGPPNPLPNSTNRLRVRPKGSVKLHVEKTAGNAIEAAANGAADGVKLALNVGGMLLAFLALLVMLSEPLKVERPPNNFRPVKR